MDETSLNELLECSVCLERLDSTSRVLPCQHTFCRRCLEEIICTKNVLRCPECRTLVEIRIEDLPTNILLIRLLEGMKTAAVKASGTTTPVCGSVTTSPTHAPNTSYGLIKGLKTSPTSSSQPCAKALYNYEAKETGDLSFKKGDLLLLRKQVDENWYHGELSGQHGFFPATYVQIITALSQEIPKCKALFDFAISDKNEKDCLTFHKDDVLTVIRRVDDNWAEGKLGDRIGIFPISFVEMNDSAKWLINNHAASNGSSYPLRLLSGQLSSPNTTGASGVVPEAPTVVTEGNATPTTSAPPAVAATSAVTVPLTHPAVIATQRSAQKRHSLTSVAMSPQRQANHHHRHSMELPSNLLGLSTISSTSPSVVSTLAMQVSTTAAVPKATPQMSGAGDSQASSSKSTQLAAAIPQHVSSFYVALYNYKPQKEDEIELKKGEFYTVCEKCQDGWFKGRCLKNANTGVFPGNYVQAVPLKMSPAKSATGAVRAVATTQGQIAAAIAKHPHITINRAHSFPKTSPLAGLELAGRGAGHPFIRPSIPAVGSRTITNVTQAQIRSSQAAAHNAASPMRTSVTMSPASTASSPQHPAPTPTSSAGAVPTSNPGRGSPSVKPSTSSQVSSTSKPQNPSTVAIAAAGASSSAGLSSHTSSERRASTHSPRHSPRGARRAERARRGGSQSHSPAHQSTSSPAHHAHSRSYGAQAQLLALHPSMSTNASITPPNVVIGATGGLPMSALSSKDDKVKKEKKDKDKLSLMKRLASAGITGKGKKSKSPPLDALEGASVSTSQHPPATHQRSASLSTANASEGATAAAPSSGGSLQHRKSGSLDSSKPSKTTKPLVRERYRCIAPYPPQSEIELELKVGDVVYVHKKREDGWFKGTLQRTGKTGLFPSSFVEKF